MFMMTCFAYSALEVKLRFVSGTIALELDGKNTNLSLLLQPMQCRILGEALQSAALQMPVQEIKSDIAGSIDVKFDLHHSGEAKPFTQLIQAAKRPSAS